MIESKIRHLVMKLEVVENLDLAHPFIKGFERKDICKNDQESANCSHGEFPVRAEGEQVPDGKEVYSAIFYVGLGVKSATGITLCMIIKAQKQDENSIFPPLLLNL